MYHKLNNNLLINNIFIFHKIGIILYIYSIFKNVLLFYLNKLYYLFIYLLIMFEY